MPESFQSRLMRWKFNLFPAYRGTGARITYISGDLREVRVEIPLNWRTRNYVGTIYGGSLYGAVDPQFYPEGIDGWMVKLDAGEDGGIEFDPRFFVSWPKSHRPHQVRLQGGDCSSDSYCYP